MTWTDPVVLELCSRHGEADPERLIVSLCDKLLEQCPTESGPTPLRVLGSCQGVRDYLCEPIQTAAGCSGLLVPHDGGYYITVQSDEPEERRNFSIAHEIVHIFFRDLCPGTQAGAEEEKLCDIGAAELTMPAARFDTYLAARPFCFATIDECRREFAVSFLAAGRRAAALTDQSACLFVGTMARTKKQELFNKGEPELRITNWWRSDAWPDRGTYLNNPVIAGSVIEQAFAHQDDRSGRGGLGIAFHGGVFNLEARGYGYPLPNDPDHRQVLALARGPLDE